MFRDNKKSLSCLRNAESHFLFNMFLTSYETCDYFCQLGYGVARFFFLKADRTQVDFFLPIMNTLQSLTGKVQVFYRDLPV